MERLSHCKDREVAERPPDAIFGAAREAPTWFTARSLNFFVVGGIRLERMTFCL